MASGRLIPEGIVATATSVLLLTAVELLWNVTSEIRKSQG